MYIISPLSCYTQLSLQHYCPSSCYNICIKVGKVHEHRNLSYNLVFNNKLNLYLKFVGHGVFISVMKCGLCLRINWKQQTSVWNDRTG